jgi:hypothetical protein
LPAVARPPSRVNELERLEGSSQVTESKARERVYGFKGEYIGLGVDVIVIKKQPRANGAVMTSASQD